MVDFTKMLGSIVDIIVYTIMIVVISKNYGGSEVPDLSETASEAI